MHSTNAADTFVLVSPDCPAQAGQAPDREGSVAWYQHRLLAGAPYALTSDELLFEVHALRGGIGTAEREAARAAFFAKPQACLRASPLVKRYGWGVHHDAHGRIAIHGIETEGYRDLSQRPGLTIVSGMRSRRA